MIGKIKYAHFTELILTKNTDSINLLKVEPAKMIQIMKFFALNAKMDTNYMKISVLKFVLFLV